MTFKDIPWIITSVLAGYSSNYNPVWITHVLVVVTIILLIWSIKHDITRRLFGK